MASATAIAQQTGHQVVVIWRSDPHCQARLSDLFDYDGPVIEDDTTAELCRRRAAVDLTYMEVEPGAVFGAPVVLSGYEQNDIYIRSAYSLVSPHSDFQAEQRFLRDLKPVEKVRALVRQVRHPNAVSAHIRMSTGPGFDHLPHEAPDNWPPERHAELIAWRAKSHVERFIVRLDQLLAEGEADTIFVAADLPDTYAKLGDRYGRRVTWLARTVFGREVEQIQYALADLMLLTASNVLLASTWSSFSDMAYRLSSPKRRLERSGHEF